MTANQIAYASEQETERHNQVMEDLSKEANRIKAQDVSNNDQYHQQSLRIQDDYNRNYLALQKAQGDERLRIQNDLAMLEREKVQLDSWYKQEQVVLEASKQDLQQKTIAEDRRWHGISEELTREQNAMRQKQIEYEHTEFYEHQTLEWAEQSRKILEMNVQRDLKQEELTLRRQELLYDMNRYNDTEKPLKESQTWRNYVEPVMKMGTEILGTFSSYGQRAYNFLLGGK